MSLRTGRFRARPIDVTKRIPVHVGDNDYIYDDEEVMSAVDDEASVASTNTTAASRQLHIPVPRWATTNHNVPGAFRRPASYIRAKVTDCEAFDKDNVEYDMESDDERFLEQFRAAGHRITDEMFERCIDRLEKETARLRQIKDVKDVFAPPGCLLAEEGIALMPVDLQHIHDHWMRKRNSRGKALLRQFVDPPEMHDPNPKVAFRPRHKSFTRSRRRNDILSFRKLHEMRSGLERLQMILELTKRRERLKEAQITQRYEVLVSHLKKYHMQLGLGPEGSANVPNDPLRLSLSRKRLRASEGETDDDTDTLFDEDTLMGDSSDASSSSESTRSIAQSPHLSSTSAPKSSRKGKHHHHHASTTTAQNHSRKGLKAPRALPQQQQQQQQQQQSLLMQQQQRQQQTLVNPSREVQPSALMARRGRGGRILLNRQLLHRHHNHEAVHNAFVALIATTHQPAHPPFSLPFSNTTPTPPTPNSTEICSQNNPSNSSNCVSRPLEATTTHPQAPTAQNTHNTQNTQNTHSTHNAHNTQHRENGFFATPPILPTMVVMNGAASFEADGSFPADISAVLQTPRLTPKQAALQNAISLLATQHAPRCDQNKPVL